MPKPDDLRRGPDPMVRRPTQDGLVDGRSPYATSPEAFGRVLAMRPTDVVFLLDVSGSMKGEPRREMVAGVRAAAGRLTGKGSMVTLVAFSDEAVRVLSRSRSPEEIVAGLERLPRGGSTAMHRGFLEARRALRDSERAIVHLITDAVPDDRAAALAQAELCREAGIVVRCTGTTGADLEFLRLLAGGEETRRAELVPSAGLRRAIEATALALPQRTDYPA